MGSRANELPNDILILMFQNLQNDYNSLLRCALVNHAFNCAASKFLYRRVVLAPQFRVVLSLHETSAIPPNSNLILASLPQYAQFTEILEITGYLPSRPSSTDPAILNAIKAFKNLRVAILTPATFHIETFSKVLQFLSSPPSEQPPETPLPLTPPGHEDGPNLREIVVNTSCMDEFLAPILTQITGLSKLSIHSPTRTILELLPEWLRRLSNSLTELHLKDNCGSVTPGILKFIIPLIQRNVRAVSLGLSYSLTDEDVFAFLRDVGGLERVELRYYWQLKPPISRPNLSRLKSFTARHANFQTRKEVQSLCKWIRRAISRSPIQALYILQDKREDDDDDGIPSNTGANISFRSIIDHLCARHSTTLRILDMEDAYVDVKSLKKLFMTCKELEEVYLCAGSHALTILKKYGSSLTNLHTATFSIKNIKLSKRRVIDMELVSALLKHGPPLLRTLSVNGQTWKSSWKQAKDGTFALTIHKQPRTVLPWDRPPKSLLNHQSNTTPPTESVLRSTTPSVSPAPVTGVIVDKSTGDAGPRSTSGNRLRVRFSEPS